MCVCVCVIVGGYSMYSGMVYVCSVCVLCIRGYGVCMLVYVCLMYYYSGMVHVCNVCLCVCMCVCVCVCVYTGEISYVKVTIEVRNAKRQ